MANDRDFLKEPKARSLFAELGIFSHVSTAVDAGDLWRYLLSYYTEEQIAKAIRIQKEMGHLALENGSYLKKSYRDKSKISADVYRFSRLLMKILEHEKAEFQDPGALKTELYLFEKCRSVHAEAIIRLYTRREEKELVIFSKRKILEEGLESLRAYKQELQPHINLIIYIIMKDGDLQNGVISIDDFLVKNCDFDQNLAVVDRRNKSPQELSKEDIQSFEDGQKERLEGAIVI